MIHRGRPPLLGLVALLVVLFLAALGPRLVVGPWKREPLLLLIVLVVVGLDLASGLLVKVETSNLVKSTVVERVRSTSPPPTGIGILPSLATVGGDSCPESVATESVYRGYGYGAEESAVYGSDAPG